MTLNSSSKLILLPAVVIPYMSNQMPGQQAKKKETVVEADKKVWI